VSSKFQLEEKKINLTAHQNQGSTKENASLTISENPENKNVKFERKNDEAGYSAEEEERTVKTGKKTTFSRISR